MPFKETKASANTSERDAAAQASQDCPFCQGHGLTTVYHPTFTGDALGVTKDGRRYPAVMGAHCRCDLGIWMRDHNPPEIQRRIPWVQDILLGRSRWLLIAPGECEVYPDRSVDASDFARLFPFLERLPEHFHADAQ